jgi:hypothetical protein
LDWPVVESCWVSETSREVGAVDVGLAWSFFRFEPGCEEVWSRDLCGEMLRLVPLLCGDVLMLGVLAIP